MIWDCIKSFTAVAHSDPRYRVQGPGPIADLEPRRPLCATAPSDVHTDFVACFESLLFFYDGSSQRGRLWGHTALEVVLCRAS